MHDVFISDKTFSKINDLAKTKNWSAESSIETAIHNLWDIHCLDQTDLVVVDTAAFKVKPKHHYKAYLQELTGKKGPYSVEKTYQSWTGNSKGVYKIQNCNVLVPCSWFVESNLEKTLATGLIISALTTLIQSGALIYILLL